MNFVHFVHIWNIGTVECWNGGFCEKRVMAYRKTRLNMESEGVHEWANSCQNQYSIVPSFHYSMYEAAAYPSFFSNSVMKSTRALIPSIPVAL